MTILLAWLLADFISGIVHWWEDRALVDGSRFNFINSIRRDNEIHHADPTFFLSYTWWGNINTTAPFAWAIATVLYFAGVPLLFVLTAVFLGIGNLIHRWAHEHAVKRPRIVTLLQRTGILSSPDHHIQHHFRDGLPVTREESTIRYCVMSNWLNPILDRIKFFPLLERILKGKS